MLGASAASQDAADEGVLCRQAWRRAGWRGPTLQALGVPCVAASAAAAAATATAAAAAAPWVPGAVRERTDLRLDLAVHLHVRGLLTLGAGHCCGLLGAEGGVGRLLGVIEEAGRASVGLTEVALLLPVVPEVEDMPPEEARERGRE